MKTALRDTTTKCNEHTHTSNAVVFDVAAAAVAAVHLRTQDDEVHRGLTINGHASVPQHARARSYMAAA